MQSGCTELAWWEAEALRLEGVAIEYRDGGAFHREVAWRPVDGPLTEHCSDFEFRIAMLAGE